MQYQETYEKWIQSPYIKDADKRILNRYDDNEIRECFHQLVPFGTAGMRGKMGIGTNRLNVYTIALAANGLAQVLGPGKKVVIAYDTRNNSRAFAEESAKALAAAGVKALLFDNYSPVPLLSFAVRYLECDAGIAITASHNPKEYNGFKVYDSTGCQMRPEVTSRIAQIMAAAVSSLDVELASLEHPDIEIIGGDVYKAFMDSAYRTVGEAMGDHNLPFDVKGNLKIVYTPLNGSGREYILEGLEHEGFTNVSTVAEQCAYDGNFPTVIKPNPEEDQALILACRQGEKEQADLIVATDPDCDRIGVAVRHDGKMQHLGANQVGPLFIDFMTKMRDVRGTTLISSMVTGSLGDEIAQANGASLFKTLPGVKYIGEEMNHMMPEQFLMGYEESCGYILGSHIRDKDAVSATLVICYIAAYYKQYKMTLIDALNQIYSRYGHYMDRQDSYVLEGVEGMMKMEQIMDILRKKGKSLIGNVKEIRDYSRGIDGLPRSNALKFILSDGTWIAIRPSGTEPKIKVYFCIKGGDEDSMEKRYHELSEVFTKLSRS